MTFQEYSLRYGNFILFAFLAVLILLVILALWKKKRKSEAKFSESTIYQSPDGAVQILVRYKSKQEKIEYKYEPEEIEIIGEDISSCLKLIDKKYRLSSITIADSEGLVVGSTSNAPEEDAAYAVSFSLGARVGEKIDRIELIGKENSYIFNIDYPDVDTKLIVIAKSKERIPEKYLIKLEEDIMKVLGKTFSFSKGTGEEKGSYQHKGYT